MTDEASTGPAPPERPALDESSRDELIVRHLPLVRALARRYANRGEPLDDLIQVGTIGLIKAVDRFDPERGTELAAFATPTILGEIRRHFRDRTWTIRVPRGIQDNRGQVAKAADRLTASLGRSPTVAEIAAESRLSEEDVLDTVAARDAYRPLSLSRGPSGADEEEEMDVAVDEAGFPLAEGRVALGEGLRRLPARERVILHLRFDAGLTQSEIASRLGISQMHVSRLIARGLETLRSAAG